ncbi:DUF2189 domain-containing protein [Lentilitoribacter sp. EG35]|uniref:DUF2189 domain-containing protein n=1 Tax=Lentilitoribacter sp. EG35 TaxID=3234192 RepID=UPI0034609D89
MSSSGITPRMLRVRALKVQKVSAQNVKDALAAGFRDFFRNPMLSMFFGLVYAGFGLVFLAGLVVYDNLWMIIPAGVGFPLIAPFVAVGLYEMSHRYKTGESFTWGEIFTVVLRQQKREFGWMSFVVLFIFWNWIFVAHWLFAVFLQWHSISSLTSFWTVITTTTDGYVFLAVGTAVGAVLATLLFSITVISMPLLLDKEVDFITAMLKSIDAVQKSPLVMLGWGVVIAILVFLALLPAFIGIIFILPILGHATWHLYDVAIKDEHVAQ